MSTIPDMTPLEHFEVAKAAHQKNMLILNEVTSAITRCHEQQQEAEIKGKQAESSWRGLFRNMRGEMTDELKEQHGQRISQKELAKEFSTLIKELELDKDSAMLACCYSAKKLENTYKNNFKIYAEQEWRQALLELPSSLIRVIKLKLRALALADEGNENQLGYETPDKIMERQVGRILVDVAERHKISIYPDSTLDKIGWNRPNLDGVDWKLYNSPASCSKLAKEIIIKRKKLQQEEES